MEKVKEVVIGRRLLQPLLKQASKCTDAQLFLLGGRGERIKEIASLRRWTGCGWSPAIYPSTIAKQIYRFAKRDLDILGFSMIWPHKHTEMKKSHTLVGNIRRWQRNYPNCYFLLIGRYPVPAITGAQLGSFSIRPIKVRIATRGKR